MFSQFSALLLQGLLRTQNRTQEGEHKVTPPKSSLSFLEQQFCRLWHIPPFFFSLVWLYSHHFRFLLIPCHSAPDKSPSGLSHYLGQGLEHHFTQISSSIFAGHPFSLTGQFLGQELPYLMPPRFWHGWDTSMLRLSWLDFYWLPPHLLPGWPDGY